MVALEKYEIMSKIRFFEAERRWAADCAENLLKSLTMISLINTDGVDPLVSVLEGIGHNYFREDREVKMITHEELLENAPSSYDGFFISPKTV